MKCVRCKKEARYVFRGKSLCEECFEIVRKRPYKPKVVEHHHYPRGGYYEYYPHGHYSCGSWLTRYVGT